MESAEPGGRDVQYTKKMGWRKPGLLSDSPSFTCPEGNLQLPLESKHRGGMAAASRFFHERRGLLEKEKGAM
jgi:hypothetical protein